MIIYINKKLILEMNYQYLNDKIINIYHAIKKIRLAIRKRFKFGAR